MADQTSQTEKVTREQFLAKFAGTVLDREKLALGMHLCFRNASELLDDATLLRNCGRSGGSLSLAILCLEELAKVVLLADTTRYESDDVHRWQRFWSAFESHHTKEKVWASYGSIFTSLGIHLYKYRPPVGVEYALNKTKQMGFYTTFFDGNFVLPSDFVEENAEILDVILKTAEERVESFRPLHGTLESSLRFADRALQFMLDVRNARTEDEVKEVIREMLLGKRGSQ